MFRWFKEQKRKKILEKQFPESWRDILLKNVAHYSYLNLEEKELLENLVQIFIAEKNFEACGGLEMTDEIRVIISAQAVLLVLGLPSFQYQQLESVLVYPSTVTIPTARESVFSSGMSIIPDNQQVLGLAWQQGSVVLVWDAVRAGALHPERGHNVVYHEFAHILDMRDGAADGTPELYTREMYKDWIQICSREYLQLKEQAKRGRSTLLDSYGAVSEAEFFAVATELFFDRPVKMKNEYPELYNILLHYYRQDTAARELNYRRRRVDAKE